MIGDFVWPVYRFNHIDWWIGRRGVRFGDYVFGRNPDVLAKSGSSVPVTKGLPEVIVKTEESSVMAPVFSLFNSISQELDHGSYS